MSHKLLMALGLASTFALTGCNDKEANDGKVENNLEQAGAEIKEAGREIGAAAKAAGQEIKEGAGDAKDSIVAGANEAGARIDQLGERTYNTKSEFETDAKREYDELEKEYAELEARAKKEGRELDQETVQARTRARQEWEQFEQSAESAWEETRREVVDAFRNLREQVDAAGDAFDDRGA